MTDEAEKELYKDKIASSLLQQVREIIMCDSSWSNDAKTITNESFDRAIKALEQGAWISVSERLPNDADYVLVCYENGHIRTAYYYIDTNIYPSEFEDCCETGWYNYNEDFMYDQDVIAWMPLPKPFKPKERSEKE